MSTRLPVMLTALALLTACSAAPTSSVKPVISTTTAPTAASVVVPNDNLNAVAWSQMAIEHDLIYLQTYRDAQSRLLAALKDPHWDALPKDDRTTPLKGLKPAIVLDIDETVLDNSPYQARLVQSGGQFDEVGWAAWCKEENAHALPGAVEFTQFAAKHGIAVIYISNRAKDLDAATLDNLHKAGLPVSGVDAFLGLGTVVPNCEQAGSEKGCRRQLVGRNYRVLMQFGDQIGDFVDVSANNAEGRQKAMAPYLSWIGSRWFVLPNPTYGSWEPALFNNDWSAPHDEQRQQKIKALRTQ